MSLTDLETQILRAAARAGGGILLHFEAQPPEPGYLLVGGQRIDLVDPDAVNHLLHLGHLTQDMGRTLSLTPTGRTALRALPGPAN
ncbi:MAG TPA: hypothetical protein VF768_01225 [Holophagaceae bacterium]